MFHFQWKPNPGVDGLQTSQKGIVWFAFNKLDAPGRESSVVLDVSVDYTVLENSDIQHWVCIRYVYR